MALSLGPASSRRRAWMVLAGDGSLAARATVYMLLAGADGKHHARGGGVHRQGLQRAAQRGCALGIDEHGSCHDYMRVLARRIGAHLALRGLTHAPHPGLILAAGAADHDELFSWVQRDWGGCGRTPGRTRVCAGPSGHVGGVTGARKIGSSLRRTSL